MLTLKVTGVEGGREPACSEFPSAFVVSIVPTQRQFTLIHSKLDQVTPRYTKLYQVAPSYTKLCQPSYTKLCQPSYTNLYQVIPCYTKIYQVIGIIPSNTKKYQAIPTQVQQLKLFEL